MAEHSRTYRTADGAEIVAGMFVWTNDVTVARVSRFLFDENGAGWFDLTPGGMADGSRMATRHPVTGETAGAGVVFAKYGTHGCDWTYLADDGATVGWFATKTEARDARERAAAQRTRPAVGTVQRVDYAGGVFVTFERVPAGSDNYSEDQRWYYAVWSDNGAEIEDTGYARTKAEAAAFARDARDSVRTAQLWRAAAEPAPAVTEPAPAPVTERPKVSLVKRPKVSLVKRPKVSLVKRPKVSLVKRPLTLSDIRAALPAAEPAAQTRRLDSLVTGDRFTLDGITHTVTAPLSGGRHPRIGTDHGELRGMFWSQVVRMAEPARVDGKAVGDVFTRQGTEYRVTRVDVAAGAYWTSSANGVERWFDMPALSLPAWTLGTPAATEPAPAPVSVRPAEPRHGMPERRTPAATEPAADTTEPAPYVRGTKTARVRTGKLTAGMRVLTTLGMTTEAAPDGRVSNTATKTGAIVRTVAGIDRAPSGGGFHRSSTYYFVRFTDGTVSARTVAHEAWTVTK